MCVHAVSIRGRSAAQTCRGDFPFPLLVQGVFPSPGDPLLAPTSYPASDGFIDAHRVFTHVLHLVCNPAHVPHTLLAFYWVMWDGGGSGKVVAGWVDGKVWASNLHHARGQPLEADASGWLSA